MNRSLTPRLAAALLALTPAVARAQQCELPGVLIVLDRSVSMDDRIDGQRKWDIAVDAMDTMLDAHGDAAAFGLMIYPGPSGSGANGVEGPVGACRWNHADAGCTPEQPRCTTGEVVVDVGPNTADPIRQAMVWPAGLGHSYTPTWQSLEAADRYAPLRDPGRRNFAILITDGWQCCGLYENADHSLGCEPEDRGLLVEKVTQLRDHGVTPFVVGFGDRVDVASLQNMAVASGTAREGCDPDERDWRGDRHCYYQASDHADLVGMLDDIVRRISDEICDGRDNDCDGRVDEELSRPCETACGPGEETCVNGRWRDCSAQDAAPEVCNGRDDNCNGEVDEGLRRPCNNACGQGQEICDRGDWAECDAPPVAPEVCDGVDNDCDGVVDPGCDCRPGDTRPCGEDQGECHAGTQRCDGQGHWQEACEGGAGPRAEACDGRDDDCDGQIDGMERDCQSACAGGIERCEDGAWVGCDAPQPDPESCNGLDDDCDGDVDENLDRPCESACGQGREQCVLGRWEGCTARAPAAEEICNNGVDDDCDGATDEDCECEAGAQQACGSNIGVCEAGAQACVDGRWAECVGATDGSAEACNGYDDDCNGAVDDGQLCEGDQACGCGACAEPCFSGECPGDAQCVHGHCIVDSCPAGFVCTDGVCVEGARGDAGTGPGPARLTDGGADGSRTAGGAAGDNCSCRLGADRPGTRLPALLLLLVFLALGRRARRSSRVSCMGSPDRDG